MVQEVIIKVSNPVNYCPNLIQIPYLAQLLKH